MLKSNQFVLVVSSFIFSAFYNDLFWKKVAQVYTFDGANIWYFISVFIVLTSVIYIVLSLVNYKYILKPVLILLFIITSFTSYFMNQYGIAIDEQLLSDIFKSGNIKFSDFYSIKFLFDSIIFAILPSFIVYKSKIDYKPLGMHIVYKIFSIFIAVLIIFVNLYIFSNFYISFFKDNRPLRHYTNPTYYFYSVGKFIYDKYRGKNIVVQKIGLDAKLVNRKKPRLLILVIGNSVRADHLFLNGYKRDTNPILRKYDVISFRNLSSCGTEAKVSVPCMFSILNRSDFSNRDALEKENLLDILKRAGVRVGWIDNSSNTSVVAKRIKDKSNLHNSCFNAECRDMLMLSSLENYLDKKTKDTVVVLRQEGSYGSEYYKRYPENFEKFKPVCKKKELDKCSKQSVINAYDNSLLYTDYFLSNVIKVLKENSKNYETAMLYVSDNGESLGEKGVYLHSMSYYIAPKAQRHVGAIAWFGDKFDGIDKDCIKKRATKNYSQDGYFDTVLGLMGVKTGLYTKTKDMFAKCRKN